ncbi:helical membrane plugin domain-containing protein [Haloarcula halophila]|uniref:DUF1641 domain-containing protein n=1 Tax=Haloarcula TaxID=2237 RepID=UPI0023E3CC18|nr:DUF1641 domain-containing protein [Halomicroarcula sp. DFY41]
MAEPQEAVPEAATHGGSADRQTGEGEAALRAVLDDQGEALAAALDRTDELEDALVTAILVLASADDDEVDHVTDSTANLVAAADGLSTAETAALAEQVGTDAEDLADTLDAVVQLQRSGDLDALLDIATALTDGLSEAERNRLASMLEADGADLIDALDTVLALQREGDLDALVDLAGTAAALDLDDDAVAGLNAVLGAVGEAQRESEPVSLFGAVGALRSSEGRAGLGYAVGVLRALGRRLTGR